jgi:hypothetical protein
VATHHLGRYPDLHAGGLRMAADFFEFIRQPLFAPPLALKRAAVFNSPKFLDQAASIY